MKKTFEEVSVSDIDLENDLFDFSFPRDNEVLRLSIKKTGIFKPILLYKKGGKLIIIDGRKRIFAGFEEGIRKFESVVFDFQSTKDSMENEYELFRRKVYDKLIENVILNDVEVSIILNKIIKVFARKKVDVIREYFPLFRISGYYSDVYFHLIKLNEDIKEYIIENDIPVNTIKCFFYYKSRELSHIYNLVKTLKIKGSHLRIVLTQIEEIIRRDKRDLEEFLISSGIEEIKNNKKLTVSQKLSKIKVILWENRYPVLYSKDREIKKKLNALKFPKNMQISVPAFLEGNTVNISISIKEISELKKAEAVFQNLIQDENLNEILEYL